MMYQRFIAGVLQKKYPLHDQNLDTSQALNLRDLAPPLLWLAQARLSFGSCLLTHLIRCR
jgi:hypothetical protein